MIGGMSIVLLLPKKNRGFKLPSVNLGSPWTQRVGARLLLNVFLLLRFWRFCNLKGPKSGPKVLQLRREGWPSSRDLRRGKIKTS